MKHFLTSLEAQTLFIRKAGIIFIIQLCAYLRLLTTEKTIKKIEILVFLGFYF